MGALKKKRINKANWSGEKGTYHYSKRTVVMNKGKYQSKFTIKQNKHDEDIKDILSSEHGNKKIWVAMKGKENWCISDGHTERCSKKLDEAIAQMYWNTF